VAADAAGNALVGSDVTMHRILRSNRGGIIRAVLAWACALLAVGAAVTAAGPQRTFATPEDAVKALIDVVKAGNLDDLIAILGPGSEDLAASSDPVTARQNREVFRIAVKERWSLVDEGKGKTLVIGNEDWPFPVPIVKDGAKWRFDSVAGKEEVLARRIGRNELATIETCRAYVTAQQRYAQQGHDGKPAGAYAAVFRSDPGKQNGLYWPVKRGEKRSPLGDLVGEAADSKPAADGKPQPFHGYYFKILTAQGAAAPGGAASYIVNGDMSKGFALVAWPAQYNATGVMTFIVNQDGIVREKDLGQGTDAAARAMTAYNPDKSWQVSQ
jgi:Protein of unknown function (DUF2950)